MSIFVKNYSLEKIMRNLFQSFCRLFCLIFLLSVNSVFAQTNTIISNDFEKNTQNWESRGPASISSSKEQAANGSKSLKISNRKEFWNGAQLNITKNLKSDKTYQFTVSVKLAKDEKPDEIKMTMQRGDNNFGQIGSATVNSDQWTTISGKFKPTPSDPYLLVYVEATRPNTAYFIDDFKIELLVEELPKQSGTILQNDFEDMTAQNWFTRGDGVQMFSSNAGGSQSLKVGNRTAAWHGLALDVTPIFFKGRTYQVGVSARLVKGQTPDNLKVTVQITPPKGDVKYVNISSAKVTDSGWVALFGEFTGTTDDSNLLLYVEADGATTQYFIDNVVIKVP